MEFYHSIGKLSRYTTQLQINIETKKDNLSISNNFRDIIFVEKCWSKQQNWIA